MSWAFPICRFKELESCGEFLVGSVTDRPVLVKEFICSRVSDVVRFLAYKRGSGAEPPLDRLRDVVRNRLAADRSVAADVFEDLRQFEKSPTLAWVVAACAEPLAK